jgi:hypothetical protein
MAAGEKRLSNHQTGRRILPGLEGRTASTDVL